MQFYVAIGKYPSDNEGEVGPFISDEAAQLWAIEHLGPEFHGPSGEKQERQWFVCELTAPDQWKPD